MIHKAMSLLVTLLLVLSPMAVSAELVTEDEARAVAQEWVRVVESVHGGWSDETGEVVVDVQQIRDGDLVVGYYCPLDPVGFVVVPVLRGLPPVKAYSVTDRLDFESALGIGALLRENMGRSLRGILSEVGDVSDLSPDERSRVFEHEYVSSWEALLSGDAASGASGDGLGARLSGARDYQPGDFLLETYWSQGPPYNDQCPDMSCDWPQFDDFNSNAVVGCGATALAQVMKHWDWPPGGVGAPYDDGYDWRTMLNSSVWDTSVGCFVYGDHALRSEQVDAVAELSYEAGLAALMSYGCNLSGTNLFLVGLALENTFRYSPDVEYAVRPSFASAEAWFAFMQAELNENRPMPYRIYTHEIVCDGWRTTSIEGDRSMEVHMNYALGVDDGFGHGNAWYVVDELYQVDPGGGPEDEALCFGVHPAPSLGPELFGVYIAATYPYRYVDVDTAGDDIIFMEGQRIQFLAGATMECDGPGDVQIKGTPEDPTRLFVGGDESRGVRIDDGMIRLHDGGAIRLQEFEWQLFDPWPE